MITSPMIYEDNHYEIYFNDKLFRDVLVVFSSAGAAFVPDGIEEFKKSTGKFPVSYLYVRPKQLDWYNNPGAIKMFRFVATFVADFNKCYVLGESLGGSGAVLFSRFCENVYRTCAFSAQYSALPEFCKWGGALKPMDGALGTYLFSDYSSERAIGITVMFYAAYDYEDNMHSRFFKADGFDIVYFKTANHSLASHLKNHPEANYLDTVLSAFFNEDKSYNDEIFDHQLGNILAKNYKPFNKWIGDRTFGYDAYIERPKRPLISANKTATQSSTCGYSTFEDATLEATRALTEPITPYPNFHTEFELNPWWSVDLGTVQHVTDIIIFNRSDVEEWVARFRDFSVLLSTDENVWTSILDRVDGVWVGGLHGEPLVISCSRCARYVKIQLHGTNYLHLSRVEIYGSDQLESTQTKASIFSKLSKTITSRMPQIRLFR